MLKNFSWASYWETIIIILVIYYAYVSIHFFSSDIRQLWNRLSVQTGLFQKSVDPLWYQEETREAGPVTITRGIGDAYYPDEMREADQLISAIKDRISSASGKAYAPDVLKIQLQTLFQTHNSLKSSPHRPAIVELVVSECEITGTAVLTEGEVDRWWSS